VRQYFLTSIFLAGWVNYPCAVFKAEHASTRQVIFPPDDRHFILKEGTLTTSRLARTSLKLQHDGGRITERRVDLAGDSRGTGRLGFLLFTGALNGLS
jgi:hypothetical protein